MRTRGTVFEEKVRRRRVMAVWISFGYALGDAMVTAVIAFFVMWVAMPDMNDRYRAVVCALLGITNLWSFLAGWNANRVHKSSIDLWLKDADPVELDVMVAGALQQKMQLENLPEQTTDVTVRPVFTHKAR
jgi:hypothetical protein